MPLYLILRLCFETCTLLNSDFNRFIIFLDMQWLLPKEFIFCLLIGKIFMNLLLQLVLLLVPCWLLVVAYVTSRKTKYHAYGFVFNCILYAKSRYGWSQLEYLFARTVNIQNKQARIDTYIKIYTIAFTIQTFSILR